MPVRRPKSCDKCRTAKARCSLTVPCSRCAKRGLDCSYVPVQQRGHDRRKFANFCSILPAPITASRVDIKDTDPCEAPCTKIATPVSSCSKQPFPMTIRRESPHSTRVWSSQYDLPHTTTESLTEFDTLDLFSTWPSTSEHISPSWLLSTGLSMPIWQDPNAMPESLDSIALLGPFSIPRPPDLTRRERSLQQGQLTAILIFSRLTDYTRMLADGTHLPPFIYAPCSLGCNDECPSNERHQCLPDTLAVCANLAQMFHSRTAGSHEFVWNQICAHVRQMWTEYEFYDGQELLHAMQAATVYGLLCSQCTDTVSSDDGAWIVHTIEIFGERLFEKCPQAFDADHVCMSRKEWVLIESMRRFAALMYMVDLLLQSNAQSPSSGECPEFVRMPLPCTRELWHPSADREWKKRYQEDVKVRKLHGRRGLTFQDLIEFRRSLKAQGDAYGDMRSQEQLAEWCEKADDFCMLLWMALTVEGEGQLG